MHFIDIQRGLIDGLILAPAAEIGVCPLEAGDVIELARGSGARFRVEGVRVRFQTEFSIRAANGEFIGVVLVKAGNEALPKFPVAGENIGGFVPVVELADNGDAPRAGGPGAETPALFVIPDVRVRAEIAPAVCQDALVESLLFVLSPHVLIQREPARGICLVHMCFSFLCALCFHPPARAGRERFDCWLSFSIVCMEQGSLYGAGQHSGEGSGAFFHSAHIKPFRLYRLRVVIVKPRFLQKSGHFCVFCLKRAEQAKIFPVPGNVFGRSGAFGRSGGVPDRQPGNQSN